MGSSWISSICALCYIIALSLGERSLEARELVLRRRETTVAAPLVANAISSQTQYTTIVEIGEPPQAFDLVIDTGSADLWVQGKACMDCSSSSRRRFNASRSKQSRNCVDGFVECSFEIEYGSGNIRGTIIEERVAIHGFELSKRATIGVTIAETGDIAQVLHGSGLLGLAFSDLAQFTIPSPISYLDSFALDLNDNGGILSINGISSKYQGPEFQWADIPLEKYEGVYSYWVVGVPELTIGGLNICGNGESRCQAAFDSGTGFIAAPQRLWYKVVLQLERKGCSLMYGQSGPWTCPRHQVPSIDFILGTDRGSRFHLPLGAYTVSGGDENFVTLGIIRSPLQVDAWVLGNIFLKQYYSVFDVKNKKMHLTRSNTTFASHTVPSSERPSYFDIIYNLDFAKEILTALTILGCVVIVYNLILLECFTSPPIYRRRC